MPALSTKVVATMPTSCSRRLGTSFSACALRACRSGTSTAPQNRGWSGTPAGIGGPMPAESPDLGPLVDHHCHGLVLHDLDRSAFEALINEAAAPSPLGTTFFDSMIGLAIRRWCAPVLGLAAHAPPEDYLARR